MIYKSWDLQEETNLEKRLIKETCLWTRSLAVGMFTQMNVLLKVFTEILYVCTSLNTTNSSPKFLSKKIPMNVVVFLVYFTFDSLLSHDLSLISDLDIMMKFTIML